MCEGRAAQVLVVVTAGWHVLCFDHNLKLMWDRSIRVRSCLGGATKPAGQPGRRPLTRQGHGICLFS
jgi:hypothetical protein